MRVVREEMREEEDDGRGDGMKKSPFARWDVQMVAIAYKRGKEW